MSSKKFEAKEILKPKNEFHSVRKLAREAENRIFHGMEDKRSNKRI